MPALITRSISLLFEGITAVRQEMNRFLCCHFRQLSVICPGKGLAALSPKRARKRQRLMGEDLRGRRSQNVFRAEPFWVVAMPR